MAPTPTPSPEEAVCRLFTISDALSEISDLVEDERPGVAALVRVLSEQLGDCAEVIDVAHPRPIYDEKGAA
ncbi:hypothetical protein JCM16814_34660 [Desulfobaculum senezii]